MKCSKNSIMSDCPVRGLNIISRGGRHSPRSPVGPLSQLVQIVKRCLQCASIFKLTPIIIAGLGRRCSGVTMTVLGLYGSVGVNDGDEERDAGRLLLGSG